MRKFPDSAFEITLSFTRKNKENEWEDFHHSFTSNESLNPILDKMELFLKEMGFEIEGLTLKPNLDFLEEPVYNDTVVTDNVTKFPTKE